MTYNSMGLDGSANSKSDKSVLVNKPWLIHHMFITMTACSVLKASTTILLSNRIDIIANNRIDIIANNRIDIIANTQLQSHIIEFYNMWKTYPFGTSIGLI